MPKKVGWGDSIHRIGSDCILPNRFELCAALVLSQVFPDSFQGSIMTEPDSIQELFVNHFPAPFRANLRPFVRGQNDQVI